MEGSRMDQKERERERIEVIRKERIRLLSLTESEAMSEGAPVWYQRMRYLREIEAAEWLANLRRTLPVTPMSLVSGKKRYGRVKSTLTIYNND